jgi:hypothetical protein
VEAGCRLSREGAGRAGEGVRFAAGRALGWVLAPLFAGVSYVRQARTLHPRGPTCQATLTTDGDVSPGWAPLAERLAGPALVRLSGALWKRADRLPDVLGCAVRLVRDDRPTADAAVDDQDLLFATVLRPWTMPISPFTTDVRDYFANDYFAVSPFDVGADRPVYFRLHPLSSSVVRGSRSERLARSMEARQAVLKLEIGARPFGPWEPLSVMTLLRIAPIDGERIRFRPFRAGRGLRPLGFVHAMRLAVYASSQRARPAKTRLSAPDPQVMGRPKPPSSRRLVRER